MSDGCSICSQPFDAASDGDGWTARYLAEGFTWRPHGADDPRRRLDIEAGPYVFCPHCTPLIAARLCGQLAARTADQPGADTASFILRFVDGLGPAEPLAEYADRTIRRSRP